MNKISIVQQRKKRMHMHAHIPESRNEMAKRLVKFHIIVICVYLIKVFAMYYTVFIGITVLY